MKCYACGKVNGHAINCPEYKISLKKIEIKDDDIDPNFLLNSLIEPDLKKPRLSTFVSPKIVKKQLAFLPFESSISILGVGHISASPQRLCKPYRLWIDENIAPCFTISGIYLGIDSTFIDCGNIPALMFRTGRWPLPVEPDKNTEFGIDLSSWNSVSVGQRITLVVNNISCSPMPFRGAMEVWTID